MKFVKFLSMAMLALAITSCGGNKKADDNKAENKADVTTMNFTTDASDSNAGAYDPKLCQTLTEAYQENGSLTDEQLGEAVDQYCAYCSYIGGKMIELAETAESIDEYNERAESLLEDFSEGYSVGMLIGASRDKLTPAQERRVEKASEEIQATGERADEIASGRLY